MKTALTFLFFIVFTTSFSQVTNNKASLWSEPSTWSNNTIPNDNTDIILNYDIVIDINATCRSINTNGYTVTVNTGIDFVIGSGIVAVDIDGNTYNTIIACNQTWTSKNLNVSRYRNGDPIPQVTDSSVWSTLTTGAWCWYYNDSATYGAYGKLYNHYVLTDPRGFAPAGWHIPSDNEWTMLSDCLGGEAVAGGKMKETGTNHWQSPNTGAANGSGFTGLAAGYQGYWSQGFGNIGAGAYFWSSTRYDFNDADTAWMRGLSYYDTKLRRDAWPYKFGFSVRCVKDYVLPVITTTEVSAITEAGAVSGGNIMFAGSSAVLERGVCWSKNSNPTITDGKMINTSGMTNFVSIITGLDSNTTYYVRAYAINSSGITYGNQIIFFTKRIETVTIGTQIWMLKNLDVPVYRNGDVIPQVQNPEQWGSTTTGAWCYYGYNITNGTVYGKLYNWFAVNDPRGLAPAGWHVASDAEFTKLSNYLGGGLVAGGKLKEAGTSHWRSPNTGADNSSGFSALPGGYLSNFELWFYSLKEIGTWWTSTKYNTNQSYNWSLGNSSASFGGDPYFNRQGSSVRCVKD